MPSDVITSRSNALVKHVRAVRDGKVTEQIFIEGMRLSEEIIISQRYSAALAVEDMLYTENFTRNERAADLINSLSRTSRRTTVIAEDVFASISDTKSPQGVIVLAQRPRADMESFEQRINKAQQIDCAPLLVMLHRINNPANAGAMLRVAEAAGAMGIIATEGTTDLFSPKALRGAMGSSFRLPLWIGTTFDEALSWCVQHAINTIGTDGRAAEAHTDIDWTKPCAVVLGAEADGLSPDELKATNARLSIPMRAPVESLNVAVALGIVLYEAARQRALAT